MFRMNLAALLLGLAFTAGCGTKPQPTPSGTTGPDPEPPPSPPAAKVVEPPVAKPPRQPGEPPGPDDAPYITGSVTVRGVPAGAVLRVGYFGSLGADTFVFGGAEAELGSAKGVRADAEKRVSMLVPGDGKDVPARYEHGKLPPGRYVVYAEVKGGSVAWKWVTVAANGTPTADLALDATLSGGLEVGVPLEVFGKVQLAPADDADHPPHGLPLFTAMAWRFDFQADVIARKAVFKGLPPGRYEVRASGRVRVVDVVPGKVAELDLDKRPPPKS